MSDVREMLREKAAQMVNDSTPFVVAEDGEAGTFFANRPKVFPSVDEMAEWMRTVYPNVFVEYVVEDVVASGCKVLLVSNNVLAELAELS